MVMSVEERAKIARANPDELASFVERLEDLNEQIAVRHRELSSIYREMRSQKSAARKANWAANKYAARYHRPLSRPDFTIVSGGWREKYSRTIESIYFAVDRNISLLKVGISTDVNRRLQSLNGPVELELLFTFEGTRQDELYCHNCLSTFRVRKEWFAFNEKCESACRDLQLKFDRKSVSLAPVRALA